MQCQRAVSQLAGRLQRIEQKIVGADRQLALHVCAQRLPVKRAGFCGGSFRRGRGGRFGIGLRSGFRGRLRNGSGSSLRRLPGGDVVVYRLRLGLCLWRGDRRLRRLPRGDVVVYRLRLGLCLWRGDRRCGRLPGGDVVMYRLRFRLRLRCGDRRRGRSCARCGLRPAVYGLFKLVHARAQRRHIVAQLRPAEPDQAQLRRDAWIGLRRHRAERLLDALKVCQQLRGRKRAGEPLERDRVIRTGEQLPSAARRNGLHEQVALEHAQLVEQGRGVFPVLPELSELFECARGVTGGDASQKLRRAQVSGKTDGGDDRVGRDAFAPAALVEQRERVAHAAVRHAGEQRGCIRLQIQVLLLRDEVQARGDRVDRNALEAVPLAAGQNRRRDLVQLRRCEDEHEVLRRLFEDLQQGVERRVAEHVHLVDDIHALAHAGGGKDRLVAQGAHVVDTVVGRGVKLDHVEDRSVVDAAAGGAPVARVAIDRMLTVDRLGQDLGAGGLAGAARADEQIGVGQPSGLDLLFERLGNMLLTDNIVKRLRPVFAIERLIHHLRASPPGTENIKNVTIDKTAHPPLNRRHARYHSSQLGLGAPTAHGVTCLMLLGSPPDMVHKAPLRGTEPSTPLTAGRRHINLSGGGNSSLL